ncbi:MAG: GTPase HflX [Thermoplasmata archaeon]|nr:GTPase HflX [Euryarchaeota archaeon]MVT36463.1 GTPase HflX [Euryarchaeota archaeon]
MAGKKVIVITPEEDNEFIQLANSLDFEVIRVFTFKHYSTEFFIGKGKLEEIKEFLRYNNVDKILINGKLKSSQWYNLERDLGLEVLDRINLIIEIFADRAKSKEARLQVELARLKYQIPVLKEWIHRAKKGEHPGFMAGGEYEVDQYYLLVQRRIKKIKEELEKVRKERDERRKNRGRRGYFTVAIAGYTNSGKSQLMKLLSGENVIVENRMFSTLVSKTSRINDIKKRILITDTVGFIKNLPPWLIEAFNATLEEIFKADIIILLVDGTDDLDTYMEKIETDLEILNGVDKSKILPVINKLDAGIDNLDEKIRILSERLSTPVIISAKTGENIELLIERIIDMLDYNTEYTVRIKGDRNYMGLLSFIYDYGDIIQLKVDDEIYIKFKINSRFSGYIEKLIKYLEE